MNTRNVRIANKLSTKLSKYKASVVVFGLLTTLGVEARADGINTNNALTPAEGQVIARVQLRRTSLVGQDPQLDVTQTVMPLLLAYGVHERIALIGVLPLITRQGFVPSAAERMGISDYGVGDGRLIAKARVFTHDSPGKTMRVAILAGVELPSYDSPFSSDSFDPMGGVSFSLKSLERNLDIDVVYKANTAKAASDLIVGNVAFTQVLILGQGLDDSFYQLNAVIEVNTRTTTDGGSTVYLSPGLQLALPEVVVEASVMSPIVVDSGTNMQPTSSLVVGMRRLW